MTEDKCSHEWVPAGMWDGKTPDGKPTGGLWYKCRKCQEKVSSKKEIEEKGGVLIHGTDNFGRPLKS